MKKNSLVFMSSNIYNIFFRTKNKISKKLCLILQVLITVNSTKNKKS